MIVNFICDYWKLFLSPLVILNFLEKIPGSFYIIFILRMNDGILKFLGCYGQKVKKFFTLFWCARPTSLALAVLAAVIVGKTLLSQNGWLIPLASSFFAMLNVNVLTLRKEQDVNLLVFFQSLKDQKEVGRYTFYWVVISFTGILTSVFIKTAGITTVMGVTEAFVTNIVFLSCFLLLRNVVLTLFYGPKAVKIDWLFLALYFSVPVVFLFLFMVVKLYFTALYNIKVEEG